MFFPAARLAFSSMIPAKGMQNINNSILPTNRNLKHACMQSQASFIDNTNSFTAISGAPKQAMYHDKMHPSAKGTAKLAASIKGLLIDWVADALAHRREHQSNQDDRDDTQTHNDHTRRQPNPHPLNADDRFHQIRGNGYSLRKDPHLSQYNYTRNNPPRANRGINSAGTYPPHDSATSWQSPYHSAPPHPVNLEHSHMQQSEQELNKQPMCRDPLPPPPNSMYHYPVLNVQRRDQPHPHGITPPPHSFQGRAPDSQNGPWCDNRTNRPPFQQKNDPTVYNQPVTQTDMNQYLHILNMMTSHILNMQPNTLNGNRQTF